jgi:hypothetical protein
MRPQCLEEPGEILHMRFARGISQHGGALRANRGHHGIFCTRHTWFVQKNVGATELGGGELQLPINDTAHPHLLESEKMCIHAPPSYNVATGRRERN